MMHTYFSVQSGWIWLVLVCLASSCVEPFAFAADDTAGQLVVDGQLTSSAGQQYIKLSLTSDFGSGPGQAVTSASIVLKDDTGSFQTYFPVEPGVWQLAADFKGEPGRTYWIEIQLDDGRFFQSVPQELPAVVRADSISFAYGMRDRLNEFNILVVDNIIDVFVHTDLPQTGQNTFLRWTVEEAYSFTDLACGGLDVSETCYFTDISTSPQSIVVFDHTGSTVSRINDQLLATKVFLGRNLEFTGRHYFNVYQYTLAKSAYQFWRDAADIVDRDGSIFDSPPAALRSNLFNPNDPKDEVLGLFEVAAVDTIRQFLSSSDVQPFFGDMSYCPSAVSPGVQSTFPSECCSCTILAGASTIKPHYWE